LRAIILLIPSLAFVSEKAGPKRRRKPTLNATTFRLQPHQITLKDWEVHDDMKNFAINPVRPGARAMAACCGQDS